MVIRPAGSLAAGRNVAARFQTAIENESGMVVEVILVERYAEALAALCSSAGGQAAVAWLDGLTYMAATAQNCGLPALQVEHGTGRNATTGAAAQIVANSELGI
jgi:ABC-type phosphate/phosphonate transport system substrate-binding protein